MDSYRRQVFTIFVITLLLFTSSILLVSFYLNGVKDVELNNVISLNDSLKVRFDSTDNLFVSNILPISDSLGKKITKKDVEEGIQGIIDFEIINNKNKDLSYDIFLTKQYLYGNAIKDNYIKFYLTDNNDIPFEKFSQNEVISYNALSSISDKPESRLLYSGNIYGRSKQKFRLRMWVSDSYGLFENEEKFLVNVGIREKR